MEISTPDWVKHAVFYEIFPDRFQRSKKARKDPLQRSLCLEPWDSLPSPRGYKGGDLWGVLEKLDYLQELGITAIYLTPIFQSTTNHRYHTQDSYHVDWLLGGDKAVRKLLEESHRRRIRIILDGVFHHVGRGFGFFSDVLENDFHEKDENGNYIGCSPWKNWFVFQNWPLSAYDGSHPANYQCWQGNHALVKLNYDNPDVREYILRVAEHWIDMGVDGWRIDGPSYIQDRQEDSYDFWRQLRNRVKAINPDAYLVGEIWFDAEPWMDGTQFDGVTNYLFTGATLAFTVGSRIKTEHLNNAFKIYDPNDEFFRRFEPLYALKPLNAQEYAIKIQKLLGRYHWELQLTQFNLLASQDTARLKTLIQSDLDSIKLAALLLFTFPGTPCIYYGDEVGVIGDLDPGNRRSFPMEEQWDQEILAFYRQIIALRHTYPALRIGSYQILFAQGDIFVFARVLDSEEIVVAVNVGNESAEVAFEAIGLRFPEMETIPLSSRPRRELLGNGKSCRSNDSEDYHLEISMSPLSYLVLGTE